MLHFGGFLLGWWGREVHMNLDGARFRSLPDGDEEVTLPVCVGEVVGVGKSMQAAVDDAKKKRQAAEQFAAEAIRVRRDVLGIDV